MNFRLLIFVFVSFFAIGCNYNMPREVVVENSNADKPVRDSALVEADQRLLTEDPLLLSESSDFKSFPCNSREIEITSDVTSSIYKITGECKKITIGGVSNKITIDKAGEIIVDGTTNEIIYTAGLDGKKPKITKNGVTNTVISKQDAEKKQKAETAK